MKISFCIPTYNHGQFLGIALDSILAQAPPEYEIVIVDGASTDGTPDVVARYQRKSDCIVYRRVSENRGVDPDIAEAMNIAQGDYCWLMSSDDVLVNGAVECVMNALETGSHLYLGARIVCTEDLVPFDTECVFSVQGRKKWMFSEQGELLDFLSRANGLVALFSYISVLVVNKRLWCSVGEAVRHYGSCYAHAYRLWEAALPGAAVEFIGSPLVKCRMGTDHFSQRGVFRRFMLDFDGYLGIADSNFRDRPVVREAFLAAVRREHRVYRLAKFYHACADADQRRIAKAAVRAAGYREITILGMRAAAGTGYLMTWAVEIRRVIRRAVGRVRYSRKGRRWRT